MQDLPVVFCVDRAGLVGADGETHQGVQDLSYLSSIPNMTVTAPKNKWELSDLIKFALKYGHPIAIRYPRGEVYDGLEEIREPIVYGKSEMICHGTGGKKNGVLLFAVGSMVETAVLVREILLQEKGIDATVVNARFAQPFDAEMLDRELSEHRLLVTMEENVRSGGFGEHVESWVSEHHPGQEVLCISVPDAYVEHGAVPVLKKMLGLDPESIAEKIAAAVSEDLEQ